MIGKTIGNLRIVSEIGRGGMGVVYLATHITLEKKFAVKCLSPHLTEDPRFRERFYMEARNQALLDHPGIVQATDFFEEEGTFFFVMEYVNGSSLADMIRESGKLSEEEALAIFRGFLDALNFAHNRGIIHRDIKPSNILIDSNGRARIMDFGIAILMEGERLTATGSSVGSPWYMSPEQIIHPLDIDHRSDVYSSGVLLYEMLAGDVPFDGESEFSVQEQQVHTKVPDPRQRNPKIPLELSRIILKAMEKSPENRFQGCAELLAEIDRYVAAKKGETANGQRRGYRIRAALLMVAILGSVVYFGLLWENKERTTTGSAGGKAAEQRKEMDRENVARRQKMEREAATLQQKIDQDAKELQKKLAREAVERQQKINQDAADLRKHRELVAATRQRKMDQEASELREKLKLETIDLRKKLELEAIQKRKELELEARKSQLRQEHLSAAVLIKGAFEKSTLIQRELKEIKLKRNNLRIATDLGNVALVSAYRKQIREKKRNISEGISGYIGILEEIKKISKPVVAEEFRLYILHMDSAAKKNRAKTVRSHCFLDGSGSSVLNADRVLKAFR